MSLFDELCPHLEMCARDIAARLVAYGVPRSVVYGPRRTFESLSSDDFKMPRLGMRVWTERSSVRVSFGLDGKHYVYPKAIRRRTDLARGSFVARWASVNLARFYRVRRIISERAAT